RCLNIGDFTGNADVGFGGYLAQRLRYRAQIAHPIVNHNNFFHGYRLPLVDGIVPAARSSSSAAMRSARPKALNTVSHWWWAFTPRRLSTCRVTPAWLTKPRKNSMVRSTSKVPMVARVNGTCHSRPGR